MTQLDFSSLEKAITQLREALGYAASPLAKQDEGLYRQFRSAALLRFKCAYIECIKALRHFLEEASHNSEHIAELDYIEMIELGQKQEIIKQSQDWENFRKVRRTIDEAYEEKIAENIMVTLPAFVAQADHLLMTLRKRGQYL